jgi:hypothetical protein
MNSLQIPELGVHQLAWKFDAHSVVGAAVEAGFGIQFQLYKNGLDQLTSHTIAAA